MKAVDGVQIAERYKAQYAVTMAQKNTWPREYVKQLIEELSRAEERERVLREALNRIRAAVGTSTEAWHIANAALTAAPEQGKEAKS